jgi:hypothetical protein
MRLACLLHNCNQSVYSVHIRSVTVRETFNAGTISKLEVDKNGTFVTVYTRNLTTDAETGGYITGDDGVLGLYGAPFI